MRWPAEILGGTCYGLCDSDENVISFERGLRGRKLLEIAIHELLHAEFPRASEVAVTTAGRDIAGALWRMGWRCEGKATK